MDLCGCFLGCIKLCFNISCWFSVKWPNFYTLYLLGRRLEPKSERVKQALVLGPNIGRNLILEFLLLGAVNTTTSPARRPGQVLRGVLLASLLCQHPNQYQYPALASWTSIYLDSAKFMYFYGHFPSCSRTSRAWLVSDLINNKFVFNTWFFSAKVHRDTFKINLMSQENVIFTTVVAYSGKWVISKFRFTTTLRSFLCGRRTSGFTLPKWYK